MTQQVFSLIAGILFLLMALVHFWRIVEGIDVILAGAAVPMWVSWIGLVVAALLAFYGLRYSIRK
jgi:hypothetical protein